MAETSEVPIAMRRSYLENRETDCGTIESWIEGGCWSEIQQLAHRLKGTAAGYGFDEIGVIATELERFARARDAARCATQLDALRTRVARERSRLPA